jgi:cell division protein ZapA (FtsZ GTPase activity inhibitor)
MGIVNIKFRSHNFPINSDDGARIKELAQQLDDRIENFSFKNLGDVKTLYITALTLQDEIDNLRNELSQYKTTFDNQLEDNKKRFSETLDYISGYIENLAEKLEK